MTLRTRTLVGFILALVFALGPAVAHASPPANDDFANAATLAVDDEFLATNLDATSQTGEQEVNAGQGIEADCHDDIDVGPRCTSSVWYTFTPGATDTYTIETCDLGTDVDTVLDVWTGTTLGSLTEVTANDDNCAGGFGPNGSQVTFSGTSGTQYHVEVTGYRAAQGMFYLRAYAGTARPAPPEPDTVITKDNSILGATQSGSPSSSGPRHSASFVFASDTAGATFQCSLDGASFAACSSPVSLDSVTSGSHEFKVLSIVTGSPDPTPAVERFTIDHDPPDTTLDVVPPDPDGSPTANFVAVPDQRNWYDEFQCGLDSQPAATSGCESVVQFTGLCNRVHTFQSAALDPANNLDPTPATFSFTENGGGACGAPTFGSLSTTAVSATEQTLSVPVDVHGDGAAVELDYGTTTAYGTHLEYGLNPNATDAGTEISPFLPGTLYHWKVVVNTPDGTADSGDQTFTTDPLGGGELPGITVGTPVVVGDHAAAVPVVVAPGAQFASYSVLVSKGGPTTPFSPSVDGSDAVPAGAPVSRVVDLIDLDPGTYHLRGFVRSDVPNGLSTMSADATFSIPPVPPAGPPVSPPPLQPIQKFKFRRGFIKVGKIRRGSKSISLVISHLPPSTSVGVTVKGTVKAHASASLVKLLGRGKARANKAGVARVKVKLSRKARKLLRKRTKSLALQVRVKPPGQTTSSITLRRKLRH